MKDRRPRLAGALSVVVLVAGVVARAHAQRLDPGAPWTLVVGTPSGARCDHIAPARTGLARALPRGPLHVAWKASAGTSVDRAPVVDARGGSYIMGARGEVVALGRDGVERWRVATNATPTGSVALLSDDTLAFVDDVGEAIGVKDGTVRWRTRVGRAGAAGPAPVPLDDGGVVVGTARDVAALDAEGNIRARTTLTEPATGALLFALGKVVVVAAGGSVWAWSPGIAEATRVGAFGSPVDGGAVLSDDHTLLAVTSGGEALATHDLLSGATATLATSSHGPWRGPPAVVDGTAWLVALGPGGEQAVAIDAAGQEVARALLAARPPGGGSTSAADAGSLATPSWSPPGAVPAPVVDAAGSMAFGTVEGGAGVVASLLAATGQPAGATAKLAAMATVELIRNACPVPFGMALGAPTSAPVVGLVPLDPGPGSGAAGGGSAGPAGLLVVCRSGAVLALMTGQAGAARL